MANRLKLDRELRALVDNVYFQPPESIKLKYPCIIYERSKGLARQADNNTYLYTNEYEVIYITKDPDDAMVDTLLYHFPMMRHERFYAADNLNHDVFTLFYK